MDFFKSKLKSVSCPPNTPILNEFDPIQVTPALKTIAKNTTEVILKNKLSSKISWSLTGFKNSDDDEGEGQERDVILIDERLYWITFPTKENSEKIVRTLSEISNGKFYVWNLSEHTYDTTLFKNNVIALAFREFFMYFDPLRLQTIISSVTHALRWVWSSQSAKTWWNGWMPIVRILLWSTVTVPREEQHCKSLVCWP